MNRQNIDLGRLVMWWAVQKQAPEETFPGSPMIARAAWVKVVPLSGHLIKTARTQLDVRIFMLAVLAPCARAPEMHNGIRKDPWEGKHPFK